MSCCCYDIIWYTSTVCSFLISRTFWHQGLTTTAAVLPGFSGTNCDQEEGEGVEGEGEGRVGREPEKTFFMSYMKLMFAIH